MRLRALVGCLLLVFAAGLQAQGTYRCECEDGTFSNSCGHQGACSGHGGIKKTATPGPPLSTATPIRTLPPLTTTPTKSPTARLATSTPTFPPTLTPTPLAGCPVERGAVKTGTDPDAALVNLSAAAGTSLGDMTSWAPPTIIPPRTRVSPYETTVWVIDAVLTGFKFEDDSDFHLTLSDSSGRTMIAEIDAPDCAVGSRFQAGILNARAQFTQRFTPSRTYVLTSTPVRITGVGMFDYSHGQTGAAPNGIELHPVLDISFDSVARPDFEVAADRTSLVEMGGRPASL